MTASCYDVYAELLNVLPIHGKSPADVAYVFFGHQQNAWCTMHDFPCCTYHMNSPHEGGMPSGFAIVGFMRLWWLTHDRGVWVFNTQPSYPKTRIHPRRPPAREMDYRGAGTASAHPRADAKLLDINGRLVQTS